MKKLVMFLLLGLSLVLAPGRYSAAESEELIDLYPYDQEACLLATSECTETKVGDSFFDAIYNGYRYNLIRGSVRFTKDFEDDNNDGVYSALEITAMSYSAFASFIINDREEAYVLSSQNNRADLTAGVSHLIYSYFDENGKLYLFEDAVHTYLIVNEGTAETPDFRLATTAEEVTYNAAETKPENMKLSNIRILMDSEAARGYVIEELKFASFTKLGVDTSVELDPEKWSDIIDGNPTNVTIPAGHSVFSFGARDRGGNIKPLGLIKSMPQSMVSDNTLPLELIYDVQPAIFEGITTLDDDASTPGTNIVVDYNASFDLPTSVTASWIKMNDEDGLFINETEKLNYSVEIAQDGVVLETIDFTYDAVEDKYIASAPVTKVDSSVFGAAYTATFKVTNPENQETTYTADIVVGVMPPKFVGVQDRFSDEGVYVDLLEGITADNGYGLDITNTINISTPRGFNFYSPKAGTYTINLDFTYHVNIPGTPDKLAQVIFDGNAYNITKTNEKLASVANDISMFTDVTNLKTSTFGWSSAGVIIEVGGDGKVIRTIDRRTWDLQDENGKNTPANAQNMFDAWLSGITLQEGGFVAIIGVNKTAEYNAAKTLVFGDTVTRTEFEAGIPDFDIDIVKSASYVLTIDDLTPPTLVAVDNKYTVVEGSYASVNDAILANVVAIDNFDSRNDIALFVTNNGGMSLSTPGAYNVVVTGEDSAGNSATVSFQVTVVAKEITEGKVDEKVEDAMDDLKDFIGDNTLTEQQIKDLIEAQEDAVGTSLVVTIVVSLVSAGLAFGAAFFVLKKRP